MNLLSYPGTASQWRFVRSAIIVLLAITGLAFESACNVAVDEQTARREAFIRTLNPNVEVYDIQIAESEGGWRYAAHTRDSNGRVNTIIGIVPEGGAE